MLDLVLETSQLLNDLLALCDGLGVGGLGDSSVNVVNGLSLVASAAGLHLAHSDFSPE